MTSQTRNHSFSLQPKASDIINAVKDQKKSGYVSDAIVFYHSHKKLNQVAGPSKVADDEAQKMPPSRGGKGIFHFLRSFYL